MRNKVVEIQGRLFHVKRKILENRINLNVEDGIKILKQYYHCDTLFKAKGYLWLCNEIKNISYEKIKD